MRLGRERLGAEVHLRVHLLVHSISYLRNAGRCRFLGRRGGLRFAYPPHAGCAEMPKKQLRPEPVPNRIAIMMMI